MLSNSVQMVGQGLQPNLVNMDSSALFMDEYLMTLSYRTIADSGGSEISFAGGKGVSVHVTNRLQVPLTPDNLESISFSIPGLHIRLKTTPKNTGLFHYGHVLVYRLPSVTAGKPNEDSEMSLTPSLGAFSLGVDSGQVQSLAHDDAPAGIISDSSPGRDSLSLACQLDDFRLNFLGSDKQSVCSVSEDYYTCISPASLGSSTSRWSARWASAIGSPARESGSSPNLRSSQPTNDDQSHSNERVLVEFKGKNYMRVLSRVKPMTDKDCEASWVVTDFTMRGELVCSLLLDFVLPKPLIPCWMEGIQDEYM